MFLKIDPYRGWYSIFYSKLINCILFKIFVQHICFVKGRWTCSVCKRNDNILLAFLKSPRFSLTSPLRQLREMSSHPVFTNPRFLCRPTAFCSTCWSVGRQSALHKENSGFATPTLGLHISTFRGYQILFSIWIPYINRFTNHFSIHS
jgi:hypothetical protein